MGHGCQTDRALGLKRGQYGFETPLRRLLCRQSFTRNCSAPTMICRLVVCAPLNFGRRAISIRVVSYCIKYSYIVELYCTNSCIVSYRIYLKAFCREEVETEFGGSGFGVTSSDESLGNCSSETSKVVGAALVDGCSVPTKIKHRR